jgi:NHL repeat-containing protein/glucodextranase-like protein
VTLLAWYAAGRRVPAVEGGTLTTGFVPVPDIPLLPGSNEMRVVYTRAGGVPEVLSFAVGSTATEVATVEGTVIDAVTGLPIAGAFVSITVNGITLVAVTDADGRYTVQVEPGDFAVAVVGEGYAPAGSSGTGTGGGTAVVDVDLDPTGIPSLQNQVAIVVPPDGTVTDFDQVTVVGTVLNPSSLVTVNGIAATVVGNRFTARHVPLSMGANTLQVAATALGSPTATDSVAVERATEPVLAVKIFSPPPGARIPGSGLVVRGFVSAKGASAVLDDRLVPVFEGVFEALDVPVSAQQTQLVATARPPEGAALDTSLDILVDRGDPAIHLEADPVSGEAPLNVALEATLGAPFGVSRIDFDVDGDGDLDLVGQPMGEAEVVFSTPRPRSPRVFMSTPEGVELTAVARVGVFLAPQTLRTVAVGNPVDLAGGADGSLYVLDAAAGRAQRFAADGTLLQTIGASGAGADQVSNPQGLAVASDGTVYIADTGNHRVQVYAPDGGWQRSIGSEGAALGQLRAPRAVALEEDRFLVVADTGNARLQRIPLKGGGAEAVPLPGVTGIASISGAGMVAASPVAGTLMGWIGDLVQDLPALDALPDAGRLAGPIDLAEGADGVVVGDAALGGVVLLDSQLRFRRVIDGLAAVRAVLPSRRPEMESVFVADGARVLEIGFPTDSPLPTLDALRGRLSAGDVSGALGHIAPSQRARYARIYGLIAPELATEAAAMGDAFVLRLREEAAIVILRRTEVFQGQTVVNAYPVQLIRNGAGEWQILDY